MSLWSRARNWASNVSMAIDLLGNAIAGGLPRMSISYRAKVARDRGQAWGCILCRLLDLVEKDHCDKATE